MHFHSKKLKNLNFFKRQLSQIMQEGNFLHSYVCLVLALMDSLTFPNNRLSPPAIGPPLLAGFFCSYIRLQFSFYMMKMKFSSLHHCTVSGDTAFSHHGCLDKAFLFFVDFLHYGQLFLNYSENAGLRLCKETNALLTPTPCVFSVGKYSVIGA